MAAVSAVRPPQGSYPSYAVSDEIDKLLLAGQFAEAEERVRVELTRTFSPDDLRAELFQKHAYLLNKLQRHSEAEIAANNGLQLPNLGDQRKATLNFELAVSFGQRGDTVRAINVVDGALTLRDMTEQFRWELYALKASLCLTARNFPEAQLAAEFALNHLSPLSSKGHAKLVAVYANVLNIQGKCPQACQVVANALRTLRDVPDELKVPLYLEQARSYSKMDQHGSAATSLRTGLSLTEISNESFACLSVALSDIFFRIGQFRQVNEIVQKALQRQDGVSPDLVARLFNFQALVLIDLTHDQEGLDAAQKGLLLQGISNEIKIQLCCQKAAALNNLNRFDDAIQTVDVGLSIPDLSNESKAALFYPKIFALIRCERIPEAKSLIDMGMQLNNVSPQTKERLESFLR